MKISKKITWCLFALIYRDGFSGVTQLVYLWPTRPQLLQVIVPILDVLFGPGTSYFPFLLLVCFLPKETSNTGGSMSGVLVFVQQS